MNGNGAHDKINTLISLNELLQSAPPVATGVALPELYPGVSPTSAQLPSIGPAQAQYPMDAWGNPLSAIMPALSTAYQLTKPPPVFLPSGELNPAHIERMIMPFASSMRVLGKNSPIVAGMLSKSIESRNTAKVLAKGVEKEIKNLNQLYKTISKERYMDVYQEANRVFEMGEIKKGLKALKPVSKKMSVESMKYRDLARMLKQYQRTGYANPVSIQKLK